MEPGDLTDAELARAIATRAGEALLALRRDGELTGRALGDEGDRAANAVICSALAEARPDDAILSEERTDEGTRLTRERVWIVDPLDGTREYSEDRDDWAVHIGLAINGRASIGAVALPARGLILSSDTPLPLPAPSQPPRMVVSRTRPPREAVAVAERLGAVSVPMGSAGAKAMAVVLGEAEIYLHAGGQYEWDNCAPAAVAAAAGLHVSRIDGSPLVYNRPDVSLPDLLICRRELAEPTLRIIASLC